ncbi:MAG: hypothetical protein ACREJJ_07880 [Candidatus Methylomirabilales bacterium]
MRKALFAVAIAVLSLGLVVGPVWAGTCPKAIKEVKEAMAKGKYDKAKSDQATATLGEAQKLHEAGQHDQALKKVQEAREALGLPKATF